ncbi:MAG: hypothetical protein WCG75_08950 [Armatimonadota bacterium]
MIASIFVMMIPIVAILTRHQQKMTLLMRQDQSPQNHDLYALQNDVQQLKSMVASIAMSVDDLKNEVRSNSQLQDRVKVGE